METHNFNQYEEVSSVTGGGDVAAKTFMTHVFGWMFVGLGITGLMAYIFSTAGMSSYIMDYAGHPTPLFYICLFAPLAIVLVVNFGFEKLSFTAMMLTFLLYSTLMGISMSVIFMAYTTASIFSIFFVTAGLFGVMALLGYTTSVDLTKFGTLMIMLLMGVIISWIVNFFMHSQTLDYVLNFVCVGIFTGLAAYKVQMLKNMGAQVGTSEDATAGKLAIWGALSLYITFINLFLTLLRIFGGRK